MSTKVSHLSLRIPENSPHSSSLDEFQGNEDSLCVRKIKKAVKLDEHFTKFTSIPLPKKTQNEETTEESPADLPLISLVDQSSEEVSAEDLDKIPNIPIRKTVNPFANRRANRSEPQVAVYSPTQSTTRSYLPPDAGFEEYKGHAHKARRTSTSDLHGVTFRTESWAANYYLQDMMTQDNPLSLASLLRNPPEEDQDEDLETQTRFSEEDRNPNDYQDSEPAPIPVITPKRPHHFRHRGSTHTARHRRIFEKSPTAQRRRAQTGYETDRSSSDEEGSSTLGRKMH